MTLHQSLFEREQGALIRSRKKPGTLAIKILEDDKNWTVEKKRRGR
jgi:hypothetical protein